MSRTQPDITVVGGYYAERCVSPEVDARFGSGGRAALALAAAGRIVRWRYYCPTAEQLNATRTVAHENLEHAPAASDELVSFRYTHPLARPEYLPFPLPKAEPLIVEGAAVLRFGPDQHVTRIAVPGRQLRELLQQTIGHALRRADVLVPSQPVQYRHALPLVLSSRLLLEGSTARPINR